MTPEHPGVYLAAEIAHRQWTVPNFATIIGYPVEHVQALIDGDAPLTPELAELIGLALGTTATLWRKLQLIYNTTHM